MYILFWIGESGGSVQSAAHSHSSCKGHRRNTGGQSALIRRKLKQIPAQHLSAIFQLWILQLNCCYKNSLTLFSFSFFFYEGFFHTGCVSEKSYNYDATGASGSFYNESDV